MFTVTYEIITPESAEHGDAAERGYVAPGEWRDDDPQPMSLREALQLCYPQEDSGSWFSECDGREDYRTGAWERRSLHPPRNITASSYGRLVRLLGL